MQHQTHKLNAVDMSCDVRMFDAKVVHFVTHTHTIIANEIGVMSCNCILHLAHDHVGMTVVGVFMVSSLDVTLHVPPLHCMYSTAQNCWGNKGANMENMQQTQASTHHCIDCGCTHRSTLFKEHLHN
jgi:hypothetical protein